MERRELRMFCPEMRRSCSNVQFSVVIIPQRLRSEMLIAWCFIRQGIAHLQYPSLPGRGNAPVTLQEVAASVSFRWAAKDCGWWPTMCNSQPPNPHSTLDRGLGRATSWLSLALRSLPFHGGASLVTFLRAPFVVGKVSLPVPPDTTSRFPLFPLASVPGPFPSVNSVPSSMAHSQPKTCHRGCGLLQRWGLSRCPSETLLLPPPHSTLWVVLSPFSPPQLSFSPAFCTRFHPCCNIEWVACRMLARPRNPLIQSFRVLNIWFCTKSPQVMCRLHPSRTQRIFRGASSYWSGVVMQSNPCVTNKKPQQKHALFYLLGVAGVTLFEMLAESRMYSFAIWYNAKNICAVQYLIRWRGQLLNI